MPWFYGYTRVTQRLKAHLCFSDTYARRARGWGPSNYPGGGPYSPAFYIKLNTRRCARQPHDLRKKLRLAVLKCANFGTSLEPKPEQHYSAERLLQKFRFNCNELIGGRTRARTWDPLIKRLMLLLIFQPVSCKGCEFVVVQDQLVGSKL